jgi:hypothetical protein
VRQRAFRVTKMRHLSLGLFLLARTVLATDESEPTLQANKSAIGACAAPAELPCLSAQTSLDSTINWTATLLAPCSMAQLDLTVSCFADASLTSSQNMQGKPTSVETPEENNGGSDSSDDAVRNLSPLERRKPYSTRGESTKIHWKSVLLETLLSTSVMHTFNLWTEAGTRDTLYGHWFQNYLRSVSELRGWSDSDRFMAPYVGHTIQGSSYGFTLRQNDPKYRDVQWGDGRDYWISLLRSTAFSAAAHAQWKIGPFSEASIGNVMLHASPGFITLVDTPALGAIAMIGEDVLDRYLIIGLENRSSNRVLLILTRSFLNPGKSFANVMAFKKPWYRPTRLGMNNHDMLVRKEMVAEFKNGGSPMYEFVQRPQVSKPSGSDVPSIELAAYPNYENFHGRSCIGGGGSGAARINASLQVVTEVSGCLIMGFPTYTESGDSLFYGGGLRWAPWAAHKVSPYFEFLVGGRKVTYEVDNPALEKQLSDAWNDGNGTLPHYPKRSDWSTQTASNGASIAAGGGIDLVVTRAFAWRFSAKYTHSWMSDVQTIQPQNGFRITTEAVLRIGSW